MNQDPGNRFPNKRPIRRIEYMKTKIGMSLGLALTLMVGVFATMLALGLFTTTR